MSTDGTTWSVAPLTDLIPSDYRFAPGSSLERQLWIRTTPTTVVELRLTLSPTAPTELWTSLSISAQVVPVAAAPVIATKAEGSPEALTLPPVPADPRQVIHVELRPTPATPSSARAQI